MLFNAKIPVLSSLKVQKNVRQNKLVAKYVPVKCGTSRYKKDIKICYHTSYTIIWRKNGGKMC